MVAVLRARALAFAYPGPRRALAGVDVALGSGELACLLGPNGSGKSTCLRCLAGLLRPGGGAVELDGAPLERLTARERARAIAFVPQALPALPEIEVRAFVLGGRYPYLGRWQGFLGRPSPADRAAVETALAEADALDLAGRGLDELSLGQRQRVLVARALAQEAGVLLFDEPTAALDPEHQVRVFALIERLVALGRTALVATHELNLASRYATRCLLLAEGRVVAEGAPAGVLRPEVLGPVFGRHLLFTRSAGATERPLVIPWPDESRD